eukprot:578412-Amphidinium_carterae.1
MPFETATIVLLIEITFRKSNAALQFWSLGQSVQQHVFATQSVFTPLFMCGKSRGYALDTERVTSIGFGHLWLSLLDLEANFKGKNMRGVSFQQSSVQFGNFTDANLDAAK